MSAAAISLTDKPARVYKAYQHPLWRRILINREAAIIGLLFLVAILASFMVPNFAHPLTLTYLIREIAPILLIAMPMSLIIITEEIDLSVASTLGLASVVTGLAVQAGWPVPAAAVLAVVVGVIAGAINGSLVTFVGLPSLAVTIGTLALFRGIAVGLLGTTAISDFPKFWTDLARVDIPGTPVPAIILPFLVLLVAFTILLHFTPFGRSLYTIGLNKEVASFSGINVGMTKFWLFVMSGAVSGLAGVYFTLLYSNARGDNAIGMELQIIAAVLLGGVSILGGRGAMHGVIAGVFLIGTMSSALRLAGITSDIINIIVGVVLILSVVSASFLAWVRTKRIAAIGKKEGQAGSSGETA